MCIAECHKRSAKVPIYEKRRQGFAPLEAVTLCRGPSHLKPHVKVSQHLWTIFPSYSLVQVFYILFSNREDISALYVRLYWVWLTVVLTLSNSMYTALSRLWIRLLFWGRKFERYLVETETLKQLNLPKGHHFKGVGILKKMYFYLMLRKRCRLEPMFFGLKPKPNF